MENNMEILIDSEKLQTRIKEVAKEIEKDYGQEEVVFCSVLKGAIFFTVDLMKNYSGDARVDFVRVSSYEGDTSTGKIDLKIPLKEQNIKDKNIVIVEDIVDTGRTLDYLVKYIESFGPKSVKTCVLLDKPSRRVIPFKADYVGFPIEDLFVIGFGLDYDEKYRNLPYIAYIKN